MKGEQLPAHGGVWKAEFDVALDAAKQCGIVVLEKNETFEPIEPPWQAIKQWIPADEIVVLAVGSDTGWYAQHSNESPPKRQKKSRLVRAT